MPNILLTNFCNRKCPYCFAQNEMRNASGRGKKDELSFKNLKIILDFLEKSGEKIVRLMGGEPTLHSKFKQIIDYILSRGFRIYIFTNGLFSEKIAGFLASKGKLIKYSFNIDSPKMYSSRSWRLISGNLKIIVPFGNCLVGSVIWKENFNIDYLLDLAERYSVKIIMLRLANPVVGENNKYIPPERYPILAKNIIREVKKASERKIKDFHPVFARSLGKANKFSFRSLTSHIKIGFGCGFSINMFSNKQLKLLKNYNILNLKWGCDANSGRFDIVSDLSIFRCFPLADWHKKKLADFKNAKEAENYFTKLMRRHQSRNSHIDFIHQGPCFAYLMK